MMRTLILFGVVVLMFLGSCKKGGDGVPDLGQGTGHCRLSNMLYKFSSQPTSPDSASIQYNSDGRPVVIHSPYGVTNIVYNGNVISVLRTQYGGIIENDTLTVNGPYISSASFKQPGSFYDHFDYTYDANGTLLKSHGIHNSSVIDDYFKWSDGDIISDSAIMSAQGTNYDSIVTHYEYYTDKFDQYAGQMNLFNFLHWGLPLFHCKHLLKSLTTEGNNSHLYFYTFDAEDKITTSKDGYLFQNDTTSISYFYDCK